MRWLALVAALLRAVAADAAVRIDAGAARATLASLGQPGLTRAAALAVADLPGNRAMIRKLVSFGEPATRATFADALVAAARGTPAKSAYNFSRVAGARAVTLALLDRIARDPAGFDGWVAARVARFTPAGLRADTTGYLIAGGKSDGFAFSEPAFYLDISSFGDDLGGARVSVAHELYHAVQNIAQAARPAPRPYMFENERYAALPPGLPRECYATRAFFDYLLAEGTATYVGDPALLPPDGIHSRPERERFAASARALPQRITLLEMSLAAITGDAPTAVDDVYAVGFYAPAPLYDLGYAMARAVAEKRGNAALAALAGGNGDRFVRAYGELAAVPGSGLPPLGARARRWAARTGCAD